MKQLCILIILLFVANLSSAQEDEKNKKDDDYVDIGTKPRRDMETFSKDSYKNGIFLAATADYGRIEKANTYYPGGKLAYIINGIVELGVKVNGLHSQVENDIFKYDSADLNGGYGGLHIGLVLKPYKKVHVTFPVMIGWGDVAYSSEELKTQQPGQFPFVYSSDNFIAGQLGSNAVFNISKNFQIEGGLKYTLSEKIELERVESFTLNGLSGGIGLRFGIF